jgi:hypothetical protein
MTRRAALLTAYITLAIAVFLVARLISEAVIGRGL